MLLDGLVLGVRTNDAALLEVLRALLADHLVDGYEANPNVSIWRATADDGAVARPLHRLYWRSSNVLHTKSLRRVVLSGLGLLESFTPPPPGLLALNARVFVSETAAVLVHDPYGIGLDGVHEQRLRRLGWRLLDSMRPIVDRNSLEVVVSAPSLELSDDGLAVLDALEPASGGQPEVIGRFPIVAVLSLDYETPDDTPESTPATRVAALGSLVFDGHRPVVADDLDVVRRIVARAAVVDVAASDPKNVLDALRSLTP